MIDDKPPIDERLKEILRSGKKPPGIPLPRGRLNEILHPEKRSSIMSGKAEESEGGAANCEAFGYLRGMRDTSASVEFRFRNGNSSWFSYGLLGSWQYNPSEGILLKFSGDVTYLVLIKGSNLDKPLTDGSINLTHAGLQRHRILWVREMSKEEIETVGERGPTIDSIEIGECPSFEERQEWIKNYAPAFIREPER